MLWIFSIFKKAWKRGGGLQVDAYLKKGKYKIRDSVFVFQLAPRRESKTGLDFGFHCVDSEFQKLYSILCHWNLESGLQSPMIPDSKSKIVPDSRFTSKNFPDSGIQIPLHWAMQQPGVVTATETERRIYHDARPNRARRQ